MDAPSPLGLVHLIRAVAVLALPASAQAEWMRARGAGPGADELALEFEVASRHSRRYVEAGWLEASAVGPLLSLESLLDEMSTADSCVWQPESLRSSSRWQDVRGRAREVLESIS